MKILVTGAYGQLGKSLQNSGLTADFTDVDTLDICNGASLEKFVRLNKTDLIVNCAAYTAVDRAEDEAELCRRLNCDAVRNIGEVAAAYGVKVIHISTDYVFDGQATSPYREDAPVAPSSVYGTAKLAGEKALTDVCSDAIIIRTAWLYSETGSNFVRTMLRLGNEREEIGVVADQRGTPTYAADLAAAIIKIIESQRFITGVYHFTDAGECTWYDFAIKIFELSGLRCRVKALTTAEYPTRASRPAYSVLDKSKIREIYGVEPPLWEDSLKVCLQHIYNKALTAQ